MIILYFLILLLISFCIVFLSIIFVLYLFIGNIKIVINVIKNSLYLSFNKKIQKEILKETTDILNKQFKKTATEIIRSSNEDIIKELNISNEEVNELKEDLRKRISDKNIVFIPEEGIEKISKEFHLFSFFNQLKLYGSTFSVMESKLPENKKKSETKNIFNFFSGNTFSGNTWKELLSADLSFFIINLFGENTIKGFYKTVVNFI